MALRTRARGRAVMAPHGYGVESLAAQSRLALVRPGLLQALRIRFSHRQCWRQSSLGLPAQQRTWGIAAISAGKCRRFGHRNLKRITMERIMTVKAWTREDGILSHFVGHDARAPVSTLVSPHLTVRLSTLGDPSGPRRTAPSPQP